MFKYLFDLSYDRNYEEALVFYFFYVIFAYFFAGIFNCLAEVFSLDKFYDLMLFEPFLFYTSLSVTFFIKKNLKDRDSIYFLTATVALTLLFPIIFAIASIYSNGGFGFEEEFILGVKAGLLIWLIPSFFLGCIPVALLSMKEDRSIRKIIKKWEKEQLEHDIEIERQLLLERTKAKKEKQLKDNMNNDKLE